jgi:hypothetical protein
MIIDSTFVKHVYFDENYGESKMLIEFIAESI